MTSYPITITGQTMDTSIMQDSSMAMMGNIDTEKEYNGVYAGYATVQASAMMNSVIKDNDLKSFKAYLDNPSSDIRQHLGDNGIVYSYNLNFEIFSYDPDGNIVNRFRLRTF